MKSSYKKPEHWIPADGIAREVLQLEIQKFLGNDATSAPKSREGRPGYAIFAFRNFTQAQIQTLQERSAEFQRENSYRRGGGRSEVSYEAYHNSHAQSSTPGAGRGSGGAYAGGYPPSGYDSSRPTPGAPYGSSGYPEGGYQPNQPGYGQSGGYQPSSTNTQYGSNSKQYGYGTDPSRNQGYPSEPSAGYGGPQYGAAYGYGDRQPQETIPRTTTNSYGANNPEYPGYQPAAAQQPPTNPDYDWDPQRRQWVLKANRNPYS